MDYTASLLILAALLGCIPGAIAQRKGHSFAIWWLFGALLFVAALPLALLAKPSEETRRQCPHCRTWIDREATVCPQCSRDLAPASPAPTADARRPWEQDRSQSAGESGRQAVLVLGGIAFTAYALLVVAPAFTD